MGKRISFSAPIGNILEHYDLALFGLLAPFLSPIFFNQEDPLTGLILTYGMLPLGILARPLGSLFFGWIGDVWGRRQALVCTLLGVSIATVAIGCLPTYAQMGIWAPLLLAIAKIMQNFFAAGESTGGAIYLLENSSLEKRSVISSLFDASSMSGVLLASSLVALFSSFGWVEQGWRLLFYLGGLTALSGLLLRLKGEEGADYMRAKKDPQKGLLSIIKENRQAFFAILFASGFSYVTYSIPFTLMNGFVPLVTDLTRAEAMRANTLLLGLDMALLPLFGWIANRCGKERVMLCGAIGSLLTAIPLFLLLDRATSPTILLIRFTIVLFGVAFAAPFHAWTLEQVAPQYRFRLLALAKALGNQLIGAPAAFLSLWLYKQTGWIFTPGLYLALAAGFTTYALLYLGKVSETKRGLS